MSFKETWDEAIALIRDEVNEDVTVEPGKFGIVPTKAPFVWVYLNPLKPIPYENATSDNHRRGKLSIFAGAKAERNQQDAMCASYDLIEQCLSAIEGQPFVLDCDVAEFDGMHSDVAVYVLEAVVVYNKNIVNPEV